MTISLMLLPRALHIVAASVWLGGLVFRVAFRAPAQPPLLRELDNSSPRLRLPSPRALLNVATMITIVTGAILMRAASGGSLQLLAHSRTGATWILGAFLAVSAAIVAQFANAAATRLAVLLLTTTAVLMAVARFVG